MRSLRLVSAIAALAIAGAACGGQAASPGGTSGSPAATPGATVAAHTHPGAIALCLESGSVDFGVTQGTATKTRAATAATPGAAETLAAGSETVLEPGDCLTFEATGTVHTLHNPGGPAVIWQAQLYALGQPPTTFLGTPAP